MATDIALALRAFLAFSEPRDGLSDNPFTLACSLGDPATEIEIAAALSSADIPSELRQEWSVSHESHLFEDVDYGQWGLLLLSPAAASQRTTWERETRPDDYRHSDFVIGEFLGDQELLIYAGSAADNRILVARPLDDRSAWPVVADDLADFLRRYLEALGDKYWERVE